MTPIKPCISVEYTAGATIITLTKEKVLDDKDMRTLQDSIMAVIEQAGKMNLILDFRNVRFLSSAVLGLLIKISRKIYEQDGQLRLCNIDPKIHEVFKITRLTKVFDIYKDINSAVEGLAGSQQ